MGNEIKIAKSMLHMWEEPVISGQNGSGTVFFSGCSLKCIYCQNYEISEKGKGHTVSAEELSKIMRGLESAGAHNINFVTPTHFTLQIIEALKLYRPSVPVVWNTSGYEKPETIELIAPYADIFLADFKYFDKKTAAGYSCAPDYPEVAKRALQAMRSAAQTDIIEDGLMKKGLIVRHLVLPGGAGEASSVLEWIAENLGQKTYVSLMSQYFPSSHALAHPVLKNRIKPLEYKLAVNRFLSLGMVNGFMQDADSASSAFVPVWDN